MEQITTVVLRDKVITDSALISLISRCLVEAGGMRHVHRNLVELGYNDFSDRAYAQLDESKKTQIINFNDFSSNQFLVICLVIFATVKSIEDDTLITTPFDEGIQLLRSI